MPGTLVEQSRLLQLLHICLLAGFCSPIYAAACSSSHQFLSCSQERLVALRGLICQPQEPPQTNQASQMQAALSHGFPLPSGEGVCPQ